MSEKEGKNTLKDKENFEVKPKVSIEDFTTVSELIKSLSKMPQDALVFIGNAWNGGIALDMHNSGLLSQRIVLSKATSEDYKERFFSEDEYDEISHEEELRGKLGEKKIADVVLLSPKNLIYDTLDQRLIDHEEAETEAEAEAEAETEDETEDEIETEV